MANRFFPNAGHFYSTHMIPIQIDCSFKVAATDAGGLGITGFSGLGVLNVFMHTTQTPGVGNGGITNPNPASGTILVQLQDNYNSMLLSEYQLQSPLGTPVLIDLSDALLTPGVAYVITTVGDATLANWQAIGVPKGLTPKVGLAFIASAAGAGVSSTSAVAPAAAAGSNTFQIEVLGNTNLALSPIPGLQPQGGQIILQARNDSTADASQLHAIADGSIVTLSFIMNNSSVQ